MLIALIVIGVVAGGVGYLQYKHNSRLLKLEAKVKSFIDSHFK